MKLKLSLAHAILAATAASTSARLFAKNEARQLQAPDDVIMCPMNYDPVCGADGRTYSNSCVAEGAGVAVISEGECPTPVQPTLPVPCPLNIAKVCGADGVTYDNTCLAEAAGTKVVAEEACPKPCTEEYRPVCGEDNATYDNVCYAEAAGITVVSEGVCAKPSISDAEVVTNDVNSESATSPSPTVKPTPTVDSPVPADATDGPADPVVGSLSDPDSPSSAPTAIIGTATLLVISAFIFVAV